MKKLVLVTSVALSFVAARSPLGAQAGKGPITVTVRAVTDAGEPVLDLKPADLAVKVNGKTRAVTSLKLVQIGTGAAAPGAAPAAPVSSAPAPFSTNTAAAPSAAAGGDPSRLIIIAIDDESFGPGNATYAKNAASSLVASLSPRDRVSIMTVPHGSAGLPPTTDRAAIQAAIAAVSGRENTTETDVQIGCRTVIELQALRGVLQTAPPDEPATIVFMSGGLAAPSTGSAQRTGSSRNSSNQITSDSECVVTTSDYQTFQTAAQAAAANLYVVHLPDVNSGKAAATVSLLTSGAEYIASASGATLLRYTGNSETALARIAKETGSYYVASLDPDPSDKGPTGRLEVRTSRDKVKVRASTEVALSARADAAAAPAGGKAPAPKDMVRDVRPFRDLPLRATSIAQRNTGDDRIKVIVLFEPIEPGTLSAVTIAMIDDKGKLTAQSTVPDADLGKPFAVLAAPAGKYRVRVAATDSSGRGGAVDDSFIAGLIPAGANLKLSGLSLWSQNDKGLVPKLEFTNEPEAIAMFELYGKPAGRMGALIEIATSADGPAINKDPIQVGAGGTSEPDRFTLTAKVPIANLAPGDYVIRALVTEEGQPETKITRTLRKLGK